MKRFLFIRFLLVECSKIPNYRAGEVQASVVLSYFNFWRGMKKAAALVRTAAPTCRCLHRTFRS